MNTRVFIPVDKSEFYRFIATEPEGRYEFERGRIVQQMVGSTRRHAEIARRISLIVEGQLDARTWAVLTDRGVETPATVRYPDVVVEPAEEPGHSLATARPALVVEVLSPSTTSLDLDRKPGEYLLIPSLMAYIVASQTDAACLAWVRAVDGTFPTEPTEYLAGDVIDVGQLAVLLRIDDIYRDLQLSQTLRNS